MQRGLQLVFQIPYTPYHFNTFSMQRELEIYQGAMRDRPSLVVLNKMDTPGAEVRRRNYSKGRGLMVASVTVLPCRPRPLLALCVLPKLRH